MIFSVQHMKSILQISPIISVQKMQKKPTDSVRFYFQHKIMAVASIEVDIRSYIPARSLTALGHRAELKAEGTGYLLLMIGNALIASATSMHVRLLSTHITHQMSGCAASILFNVSFLSLLNVHALKMWQINHSTFKQQNICFPNSFCLVSQTAHHLTDWLTIIRNIFMRSLAPCSRHVSIWSAFYIASTFLPARPLVLFSRSLLLRHQRFSF